MLNAFLAAALLATASTSTAPAAAVSADEHHGAAPTNAAFDKLKTLVGDWETTNAAGHVTENIRLASNGTVLIETVSGGTDEEMITVYHPVGDGVQMTHYCAAGNQPRLRAKKVDGDKLAFSFLDITQADVTASRGYMNGLTLVFKDADHFDADWTMKMGKEQMPANFEWSRVK